MDNLQAIGLQQDSERQTTMIWAIFNDTFKKETPTEMQMKMQSWLVKIKKIKLGMGD